MCIENRSVSGGDVRSLLHDNNYRTGSVALRHARFILELGAACIEEADEMNGAQKASERARKREREKKETEL